MATKVVEGQLPYTGGTAINIDGNKVISVLLREENNLILVNDDNELYTDLQLADGIKPSDDFPVGVTVGKILASDGWTRNGLILNRKTTSGDYARWIYGADGEIYFDGGNGTRKQVYYSDEVDALFTQLRGELATVAFTGDYNDLINRPAFLQEQADWEQTDTDAPDYIKNKPTIPTVNDATLTVQKNGIGLGSFTANSNTNTTINIPVPNVINNVTSTSTSDALSANQGKVLQDQIDNLKAMGKFLSLWDCETGLPISFPLDIPYNYSTGDYFLVENIDTTTNYRPDGVQYTGTASTTVETDEVEIGDMYIYDGQLWLLQINHGKSVSFANLSGQPSDNAALDAALDAKADAVDLNTKTFNISYAYNGGTPTAADLAAAQAAYDWYQAGKNPLLCLENVRTYTVFGSSSTTLDFECAARNQDISNGATINSRWGIRLTVSSGTVTGISDIDIQTNEIRYLDTATNYLTPYTPQYDGSPATKKYVDDNIPDTSNFITKNVNDLTYYTPTSSLATVATTGSYNDLTNTPTIPTVNNPTITFTQGGVSKGDITLNQSGNETIALDLGHADALRVFDMPSVNGDMAAAVQWFTGGGDIQFRTISSNVETYYTVIEWDGTNRTIKAENSDGTNVVVYTITYAADGTCTAVSSQTYSSGGITKIFTLSSTSDLTTAQAAYDWYASGGNPILKYGSSAPEFYHISYDSRGSSIYFSSILTPATDITTGNFSTERNISFTISSGSVTAISRSYKFINVANAAPASGTTNNTITLVI